MKLTDFSQPTPLVQETLAGLKPGRVLDVGAYEGRNSLYLARLGWEVVAIDTKADALAVLQQTAAKESLNISTIVCDVREYESETLFDVVLSLMVLHFLTANDILPAVTKMQDQTAPGGLNIVSAFTSENPAGTRPYLFEPDQLRNFYNGWIIKAYEESLSSATIPLGQTEPQRYMSARLVAQHPNPA